jgi:hypothetical protein
VTATLGPTVWTSFHIDLVADGVLMTGRPDPVPPLIDDSDAGGYFAYPVVDRLADKLAAILETHGPSGRGSTRYKDLVDLVALLHAVRVPAADAARAWQSEIVRRGLRPERFAVPVNAGWDRGYPAEARRAYGPTLPGLEDAVALAGRFVDPLTAGTAQGRWDPDARCWSHEPDGRPEPC